MGKVHYDSNNILGCDEYSLDDRIEIERSADITPFYLAYRGSCSFVQKVRNMERIGVAVGIIVDDAAESLAQVRMSDDGTGGGIRIPSMIISRTNGDILTRWLKTASSEELSQMVIMAEFNLP
jgi:hypothetical protein